MTIAKDFSTLSKNIIFKFIEDVSGSKFQQASAGGIIVVENRETQLKTPRWGEVVIVGNDVDKDIQPGMFICIEPLMWTTSIYYDKQKYWVTNHDKVMAYSVERPILG